VVLHQLVGHVLAHRTRQEAPDGLRCRCWRQACCSVSNLV
jgi:hypothetical protein